MIYTGTAETKKIYVGSTEVKNVYRGSDLIWSGFSPLDLGPALWLSDTGSDPAQWDDLSGNGRHATQATLANQPAIVTSALNGRQVRRFDGLDDVLRLDIGSEMSQPVFIFAVARKISNPVQFNGRVIDARPTEEGGDLFLPLAVSNNGNFVWNFGTDLQPNIQFGTTDAIYSVLAAGSNSQIRTNGSISASGNPGNRGLQRFISVGGIGHNLLRCFNGDIAEIIIFPTALSTAERQKVELYLSQKYAIALA
jgi:hypothetical protein